MPATTRDSKDEARKASVAVAKKVHKADAPSTAGASMKATAADLPSFPYFPVAFGWPKGVVVPKGTPSPAVFALNTAKTACSICSEVKSHVLDNAKSPGMLGVKEGAEVLCPWCIANGAAAEKLGGCFITEVADYDDEDDVAILGEEAAAALKATREAAKKASEAPTGANISLNLQSLMCSTPAFTTFNGCQWASHCGDGCAYHGELRLEDIAALKSRPSTLRRFAKENPELFESEEVFEEGEENEEDEEDDDEEAVEMTEEEYAQMVAEGKIDASAVVEEVVENDDALGDDANEAAEGGDANANFVMPADADILASLEQCYDGPGCDPAIYKFVCRHCGEVILSCDYS